MSKIKLLPKDLVNKIAAGEVIERPASVVKELIENSIDANASSIIVDVTESGISKIKVFDDGDGMDEEDVVLSFEKHSTSKISSDEDLFNVKSLGFRGEALASVAAVSSLNIITKTEDAKYATSLEIEAGKLQKKEKRSAPKGTAVIVSDLFFNTPARKKHLKSLQTELSHIVDIVTRYALSNPKLSIKLISDEKEILNSPGSDNLLNKIVSIYGKETAKNMLLLDYEDDFIRLKGLISKPYLTKSDKAYQTLFVNGRYVKSQTVSNAIYDAYHTLLFLNRNPVTILFLNIDFSKTDVNVHPQKEIIRIEDEKRLYQSIFNAIKETFQKNSLVPDVDITSSSRKPTKQYTLVDSEQTLLEKTPTQKVKEFLKERKEARKIGPLNILGQFNRLYIIAESKKGLMLIDQHAAEERVLFEKFMRQINEKDVSGQKLLQPKLIELSPKETLLISQNIELLRKLGFDIEEHGKNAFRLNQIPSLFGNYSDDIFVDIIRDLSNESTKTLNELNEEFIARKACRAAIKGGDILTRPQMYQLIEELENCEKPYSCPHGRPTIITLSLAEIEKKFKRTA